MWEFRLDKCHLLQPSTVTRWKCTTQWALRIWWKANGKEGPGEHCHDKRFGLQVLQATTANSGSFWWGLCSLAGLGYRLWRNPVLMDWLGCLIPGNVYAKPCGSVRLSAASTWVRPDWWWRADGDSVRLLGSSEGHKSERWSRQLGTPPGWPSINAVKEHVMSNICALPKEYLVNNIALHKCQTWGCLKCGEGRWRIWTSMACLCSRLTRMDWMWWSPQ